MRGRRIRWWIVAASALPLAIAEIVGLLRLGPGTVVLDHVDPLGIGSLHAVVVIALATMTPLAVGLAIASAHRWIATRLEATPAMVTAALVALWWLLVLAGTTAAGVIDLALLALLVVSVAEAGAFVLGDTVTAGVGAGLALCALALSDPPLALCALSIGAVVLVGLGARGRDEAGLAFFAVLAFPSAALVVGVPFVDWRLTGDAAATRAYVAAVGIHHPFAALVVACGAVLAALARPRALLAAAMLAAAVAGAIVAGMDARAISALVIVGLAVVVVPLVGATARRSPSPPPERSATTGPSVPTLPSGADAARRSCSARSQPARAPPHSRRPRARSRS